MEVWLPKNLSRQQTRQGFSLRYLPVKVEESFLSERKETVEGRSEGDEIVSLSYGPAD